MDELKQRFPADLDYAVSLDTTLAVSEGLKEILTTLVGGAGAGDARRLHFLQGWRAALIPMLAVPVSLIGTFALFPVVWLFDQHALAVRAGARHRAGGG